MRQCLPEVRLRCPDGHNCEAWAEIADDSECARYNEKVLTELAAGAKTRYDRIKAMGPEELADFLLRVGDFEPRGIDFCRNLPECQAAVDAPVTEDDPPELPCRGCLAA